MDLELNSGENSSPNLDSEDFISGPAKQICIIIAIIIGVVVLLVLTRLIILGPYYRKKNRIDGKVVIITGCNVGIGKETALELAKRGGRIYMACRDPVKCEAARLEIVEKTNNQNVFNRTLDLASLESIKKFADKFLEEEPRLDILINNAGIMAAPKGYTKDGFEQQFGVNHLGHFYLTNLLLDRIKESAPSRIVVVSSLMYLFGNIKKGDIQSEKSYSRFGAYSQSKIANILFTKTLSKMLAGTGVTVNCLHPGCVKTELVRHIVHRKLNAIVNPFLSFFFKSPKAGAQTTIRLALDPGLSDTSGGFFMDCLFKLPVLPKARDPQMAEWLWQLSAELSGLKKNSNEETVVIDLTKANGA